MITLQTIVGQMKRQVSKQCGKSIWQRSFYNHIIRNEQDYLEIWQYIENNPAQWNNDKFYKVNDYHDNDNQPYNKSNV